jgi:hypothetical protein
MNLAHRLLASALIGGLANLGAAAPVTTDNYEFSVEYKGKTSVGAYVTFEWEVCKLLPGPEVKGLSHWNLELDFSDCLPYGLKLEDVVVGGKVNGVAATLEFGLDPTTQIEGVKFDDLNLGDEVGCYTFTLTLDASLLSSGYTFGEGAIKVATKAGNQDARDEMGEQPGYATVTGPVCSTQGNGYEGLSPGFWKNHAEVWPAPYTPAMTVATAGFDPAAPYAGNTLMEALNFGGGSGVDGAKQILLRAAVAALLNAAAVDINYPLSVSAVLSQTNTALASGIRSDMLVLAAELDSYNNLGLSE